MFIATMKLTCQLNMVTYGNCVQTSIVLNILFLIGLSAYMYFFYWIFRIMNVIIKFTEFSQLPDKGLKINRTLTSKVALQYSLLILT